MSRKASKDNSKISSLYFDQQRELVSQYGPSVVLLMQIGKFYELYEFDPNSPPPETILSPRDLEIAKVGMACEIGNILNMIVNLSDKDKPYSYLNPYKMGFPTLAYERHRDRILENNYTIVRMDQISKPFSKDVERKIVEVVSPMTEVHNINLLPITNNIVYIYIDCLEIKKSADDYLITCGMSSVDVSTGQNMVTEIYSKKENPKHALQELYRSIIMLAPKEFIIRVSGLPVEHQLDYQKYIVKVFDMIQYPRSDILFEPITTEYLKPAYQTQFLNKVFSANSLLQQNSLIISHLGLDQMYYGRIAYLLLLQHCYKYSELIISRLKSPIVTWLDQETTLSLTHNAVNQLDVYPSKASSRNFNSKSSTRHNSLFSLINFTSTALGQRYLWSSLSSPTTDVSVLRERYERIETLVENEELRNKLIELFKKFPDIERHQRKLALKIIKPKEFTVLFTTYSKIALIYKLLKDYNPKSFQALYLDPTITESFNKCIRRVYNSIDLHKLGYFIQGTKSMEEKDCFIKPLAHKGIAQKLSHLKFCLKQLDLVIEHLNGLLPKGNWLKFKKPPKSKRGEKKDKDEDDEEELDESDKGLFLTTAKANILKHKLSDLDIELCGHVQLGPYNGSIMVTSDKIDILVRDINTFRLALAEDCNVFYQKLVEEVAEEYNFFGAVENFITQIDFVLNGARVAKKYKHFQPILVENEKSFFEIQGLRHPFAEHLIDVPFVTNDVKLGLEPLGLFIFGVNASGKSTLAKAVGLNIILAQIGYNTACEIKFRPYNKIITRLSGNDDIARGDSSFTVEMKELQTILREADDCTLVLGDELCRGTENISGTSLTIATALTLIERKSSFIFSTHMHHLTKTRHFSTIPKNLLSICHLATEYNESLDTLFYDRKLKEGQGSTVYGLEVAKSLKLDPDFIAKANEIRRELALINDEFLTTKPSRYNNQVYVDVCAICGTNALQKGLETHHIQEQAKADEQGFIGHIHKNSSFNLVVLCADCHDNLHHFQSTLIQRSTLQGSHITLS